MSGRPAPVMLDLVFRHGTVELVEQFTGTMRRIRIAGEALRDLAWTPGQHIRLLVGELKWTRAFRDALRTYTVWNYDRRGLLDLCVLDHPAPGPGARWASAVRPGHRVALTRPEGRLVLRDGPARHVFVGDETAAVAFGAMLRALPASAHSHALLESSAPESRLPLPGPGRVAWVDRGALLDALRDLELPDEAAVAYIAGEARTCQAVRRHFIQERAWPRRAMIVKPFWTPGRRGLD